MNRRTTHSLTAETLEARRLLSAGVANGTLSVVGTSAGDAIVVYASPPQAVGSYVVSIRAAANNAPLEEFRFPMAGITYLSVRGLGGDDTIRLDALNEREQDVRTPSRIEGGPGNDTIVGTSARDFITGGFGNDLIIAKGGDDWVDGGWGVDDLRGGDGNDYVYGSYGHDYVYGEAGDDRLVGGPGDDQLGSPGFAGDDTTAEPGNDLLLGNSGEDWMNGGAGADLVYGGVGSDHFSPLDTPAEVRDRSPAEGDDVPTPSGQNYVTFAFRGTVTSVSGPGGGAGSADWPKPGTEFRGTYTFNPIAVDTTADRNSGGYDTPLNGPVRVEVGDYRWAAPSSYVVTHDLSGGDLYEAGSWIPGLELVSHPEVAAVIDHWNFNLHLEGDASLLKDYRLPRVPPSLEHATRATLTLSGDNGMSTRPGPDVVIEATLDELTLVPRT